MLETLGSVLETLGKPVGWIAQIVSSVASFFGGVLPDFSTETIGFIMLAALFGAIIAGFPIAQTLMVMSFGFGAWAIGDRVFSLFTLSAINNMTNVQLAAVPLFIFMGYILEQAGLMDRLFTALQLAMANLQGSLYLAVISAATIFAAATGIVGASVTLIGLMAIPSMTRSGYDTRLSAGAITAGGTLGILIPPSIMLVVMAPVLGVNVLELFAAAIFPGLILSGLYITYAMVRSYLQPDLGPPLPKEEQTLTRPEIAKEILLGIIPPTVLIAVTLGSILFGVATTVEGSALGAAGAFGLAVISRRLDFKLLKSALESTMLTTSMIMILVVASDFFGRVFSRVGSASAMANALVEANVHWLIMLGLILLLIFILGWPLEWVPIVLIFIPILLPVIDEFGYNKVWFGILIAVTLQTAWLSPPVALSAYFLKGVAPHWDLKDIYAGMFQFMGLQVLGLIVVLAFPPVALWLPSVLVGG